MDRREAMRKHLVGGEFPLGQDVEHLPPDIAGGADDGDFVAHDSRSFAVKPFSRLAGM